MENAFRYIDFVVENYKESVGADLEFNPHQILITLMGGEPLVSENYAVIEEILSFIKSRGFSYNIITNGFNIGQYLTLFDKVKPQSVQVTIDGIKDVHDRRRIQKDGTGTFDIIIKNVHALISREVPVYIRMNIDKDNIDSIKLFAQYMQEQFKNSKYCIPYIYPMQDGGCLYDEAILDESTVITAVQNLEDSGVDMSGVQCVFHGSTFIQSIANNSKIKLKLRNCCANKKQYILDSYGDIYKCWFGIGNKKFSIGKYCDLSTYNGEIDTLWKKRTVNKLAKCSACKYRYLCGGGCLSHIYAGTKDLDKTRCVNFYDLIKLQLKHILKRGSNND